MNTNNDSRVTHGEPINTRAAWRPLLKPIGRVLVAAQLALVLQPLSVLAQDKGQAPYNPVAEQQMKQLAQLNQKMQAAAAKKDRTPADQVSDKLAEAQETVARIKAPYAPNKGDQKAKLRSLLSDINAGAADVRAEFATTRAELQKKNLPAEILARHDEAVAQFEQRAANFRQIAEANDDDDTKASKLDAFFKQYPAKRKPGKFDAKKLPWSNPEPNKRMPAETQTAWFRNLYGDKQVRLAQAGGSVGPLQFDIPPEPGEAPTTADLAETDEVQITSDIRALAQQLGNNPVNIYNWVRNTVEWAPTAGAIQSAQDTLDKKRGNATDTASLLIALLRAANVPARYQWGTIDVPADKAMNWVGGATVPQAALQVLNQGGIAARGLASSGRLATVRMEHVWVQAYVNWSPSRGSRNATDAQHPNPNAALNAWVPLDASFKQYTFAPGMDLKTQVPLDATALVNAAKQGATINEAEGWVQNVNRSAIQSQLNDYQNRLKSYVESQNANASIGDVIGKKILPQSVQRLLPGTLPNAIALQSQQASAVPNAQQHKFTYRLYASDTDQANESPMLSFTEKTSRLAGKRVTLTYLPASQRDADVIASYLPKSHADGSPILPSELPTSLPGYLIYLKATISVDGQVAAQAGQALPMGTDLYSTGGFTQLYDTNQWDLTSEETNVVGNVTAIGVSAGGTSIARLATLSKSIARQQALAPVGPLPSIYTPLGEEIGGSLLTAVVWTWFAQAEWGASMIRGTQHLLDSAALGYGLVHAVAQPSWTWGVIRSVTFPGMNMDVAHARTITASVDGDSQLAAAATQIRGYMMSSLEGVTLEQFFGDQSCQPNCQKGISATRVLGVASLAGQAMFSLGQSQIGTIDTRLSAHAQSTRERVRQALEAGRMVIIHESPISTDGWSGAAFIILDPDSGSGAYLLDGGANGGFFKFAAAVLHDPSLLRTPCGLSFLDDTIEKFKITNDVIPGIALPTGATLLTASWVAEAFGGMTFFDVVRLSMRNPQFLPGNITFLTLTAILNFILMSVAFEVGILLGAGISAGICRRD